MLVALSSAERAPGLVLLGLSRSAGSAGARAEIRVGWVMRLAG
jgi:hypothetical protein